MESPSPTPASPTPDPTIMPSAVPVMDATATTTATMATTALPPTSSAPTPTPVSYESVIPAGVNAGWARLTPAEQRFTAIGAGALLVLAVSTLMTWISISGGSGIFAGASQSAAGTSTGWGKILLLLSLAGIGGTVYAMVSGTNVRLIRLSCAAVGSFAALFLLILMFRIPHAAASAAGAGDDAASAAVGMMAAMGIKISAGLGIYLGLLAGLMVAAAFSLLVAPALAKGTITPADKKELPIFVGGGALVGLIAAFLAS